MRYRAAGFFKNDQIRHFLDQLKNYHHCQASVFGYYYNQDDFLKTVTFPVPAQKKGTVAGPAIDTSSGRCIRYCVSWLSVDFEKTGEIESLFVSEPCRSEGIGTTLMTRTIAWLDNAGAVRKRVTVTDGNEVAGTFYRRFGFYPRMTVLEQKTDG